MTSSPRAPFRADHVGSLLRPQALLDARQAQAAGQISAADLRRVEDESIAHIAARQRDIGLQMATDGEFRRFLFNLDFLEKIVGLQQRKVAFDHAFQHGHGEDDYTPAVLETVAPLRHANDITVDGYRFLADTTDLTAKVTMPSPSFAHYRGGRDAVDPAIYPDMDEFFADLAAVYRDEIMALAAAGCRYVQLDEVHFTFFCDPALREALIARGDDPDTLAKTYTRLINECIAGRPDDMAITVRLCRGNYRSGWVAQGGYEPIAEQMFNELEVDGFFLEYDDDRAGDFQPLRFLPPGKTAVLGMVTTKSGDMETEDGLKRRLDEAAQFAPLDQLALSPQCGFASSTHGNDISEDAQWAKLELIVETARAVWG